MRKYGVIYSDEVYNFLLKNANKHTIKELSTLINQKYGLDINNKKLAQYCIKMGITYKYEKANKSHSNKATPIGMIVRKTDGDMLKVKVGNHKWKYLQRVIYEQYNKVELQEDEYVIFLDQNKRNFDISNLKCVKRRDSAMLSSFKLYSRNPYITNLGLKTIELYNRIKEIEQ